jgi:hypothetical protein
MNTTSLTVSRTFAIAGQARLTLLNVQGEIDIRAGEADRIEATAVKHPGRGAGRTEIEMTQADDGSVTIATRYVDDFLTWLALGRGDPCRVDYVVRVPRACLLDLSYVSGPASVVGLDGAVKVRSVSGGLHLADLAGSLDLKTVSGPIQGERLRLTEPLVLDTVSGDVTLIECHLPGVSAETVSGRLRLDQGSATGVYRFHSVSGSVHLTLPAGSGCAVTVQSLSGRLRSGLPSAGSAGQAAAQVRFHSVSGDLTLDSPAASEAPAEPSSPAGTSAEMAHTAAERLAVLEQVSRGEMTVNAALGALKA